MQLSAEKVPQPFEGSAGGCEGSELLLWAEFHTGYVATKEDVTEPPLTPSMAGISVCSFGVV